MENPIIMDTLILGIFMYKILCFIIFMFISSSLEAYTKKIILVSFSHEKKAQVMFKQLLTKKSNLYKLSQDHNFTFTLRKSGQYHIISAEVFKDSKVLHSVLKELRKQFDGAFVTNYSVSKSIQKKVLPIHKEVEQKELAVVEVSPIVLVTPKIKAPEVNKSEISTPNIFNFEYYHLVIVFFFFLFFFYYIKLKRIYDSY